MKYEKHHMQLNLISNQSTHIYQKSSLTTYHCTQSTPVRQVIYLCSTHKKVNYISTVRKTQPIYYSFIRWLCSTLIIQQYVL